MWLGEEIHKFGVEVGHQDSSLLHYPNPRHLI